MLDICGGKERCFPFILQSLERKEINMIIDSYK